MEKKLSKMSSTQSSLPNPFEYCAQRKRQDGQVYQAKLRISSIPRSNTSSIHEEQKSITSRQKQAMLAPIQARKFLLHLQMDIMDLRNLPCSCHRKLDSPNHCQKFGTTWRRRLLCYIQWRQNSIRKSMGKGIFSK